MQPFHWKRIFAVLLSAALVNASLLPSAAAGDLDLPTETVSAAASSEVSQPPASSTQPVEDEAPSSEQSAVSTAPSSTAPSAPVTPDSQPDSDEPYVKSDTTIDFTVTQGQTYAFRFEVIGTHANPNITAGNGAVLRTEEVKKVIENGNDVYYFKVRATGNVGEASAVYTTLPGQKPVKHCVIRVSAPYVKSDTTIDFSVKQGNTYAFRFDIIGPQGLQPNITTGNGRVLQTENVRKTVENGHDVYFFTVRAIGKVGEASSVYTTLPGQAPVKHCMIRVAKPDPPPAKVKLNVPYISQVGLLPTGCEIISAMMLMKYWGVSVSTDTFLSKTKQGSLYMKNGRLTGPSPDEAFVGNPHSSSGFGCFPPVIVDALRKLMPSQFKVTNTTGTALDTLAKTYLPKGQPVLIWATMNMTAPYNGRSWVIASTGKTFTWPAREHCLVLVGYDANGYWLNDPYQGNGVVYWNKSTVDLRYRQLGQRSVAVTK